MTEALAIHGGATTEDIFFGQTPQLTDWAAFYASPDPLDKLLAEAHRLEPLHEADINENAMWVLQQKMRIRLRVDAGKSPVGETCSSCGTHKVDAVLKECLWCREWDQVVGGGGSRGSCEYIKPCYDVKSRSWGLLFYQSHGSDDAYMLWLALGYKTFQDTALAFYPLALYSNWLQRKYNALYMEWHIGTRFFSLEMAMKLPAPLTPQEVEKHLRGCIREDMTKEHNLASYYVRDAIGDFEREDRDD